jgi:hypothetical protein
VPVTGTTIAPGGFAVFTEDPAALVSCFGVPEHQVCGVDGRWPTVNRTGGETADSVIVVDAVGLAVDAVSVPAIPSSAAGRSLERVDLYRHGDGAVTWVLSQGPPTPGRAGERVLLSPPPPGDMRVTPNPFVPGDGLLTVSLDAEPGTRAVFSVFDPRGRRLASLGVAASFPAVVVWNGRDDNGRLVLPGLYVLACELTVSGRTRVLKEVVGCARP